MGIKKELKAAYNRQLKSVGLGKAEAKGDNRSIAWKGQDGQYRVIEFPYNGKMSVQSKAPQSAAIVQDAAAAFNMARSLYNREPSKSLQAQAKADSVQGMKAAGITSNASPAISGRPFRISAKPPRISE